MTVKIFTTGDFIQLRDRNLLTWIEVLHYLKRGAHEVACNFDAWSNDPIGLQAVTLERDIDRILKELTDGEAHDN